MEVQLDFSSLEMTRAWTRSCAACSVRKGLIFLLLCKANLQDQAVFAMCSLKVSWSSKITPRFLTKLDVVIVACFQVLCFSESIPLCKENMFPNIRMVNILIDITYISILEIIQNNILCKYIIMYWIIHKELPLSYIEKYVTIYLLIYHNICNFIFTSTL